MIFFQKKKQLTLLIICALGSILFSSNKNKKSSLDCFFIDTVKIAKQLNSRYRINCKIYSGSVKTDESSRINYAYIAPRAKSTITCEQDEVRIVLPLTADISYSKWVTAFGKKYRQDTLLRAVNLDYSLLLHHESNALKIIESNIKCSEKENFMQYIIDMPFFQKSGKIAQEIKLIANRSKSN